MENLWAMPGRMPAPDRPLTIVSQFGNYVDSTRRYRNAERLADGGPGVDAGSGVGESVSSSGGDASGGQGFGGRFRAEVESCRSPWGLAICELASAGWSERMIARHIGCSQASVSRLRTDPRSVPLWQTGQNLIELRDAVRAGISRWGRIIVALKSHGFGTGALAQAIGVSRYVIHDLETKPAVLPEYGTAIGLIDLYRRHVAPLSEGVRIGR